jgi:hypothetical protein
VAVELLRRGHHPAAYSTLVGPVAEELRAATVPVINSLESLAVPPDIIHGHHHYDTLTAMMWFPHTPAVYFCHGWIPWEEAPLRFPRIHRYVAVDELCRERLIVEGGVAPQNIDMVLNFFDETRFPPRPPLPEVPRRAVAFDNLFAEHADLPVLREACGRLGLGLDTAGIGMGNPEANPGAMLGGYDIVFAKARAAIEAMAVGAAVVLCTPGSLGPMVTSASFASLRPLNFGSRALSRPLTADLLCEELARYDSADAAAVSRMVRQHCELKPAVDQILRVYEKAIHAARASPAAAPLECDRSVGRYLEQTARMHKQSALAEDRRRWVERCLAAERRLANGSLAGQDSQIAGLQSEIAGLRASATWRWTQGILGHPAVKRVFGALIRSVAARSRRGAGG